MSDMMKTVGAKIRMYRKAKRMSLEDLSTRIYKSKSILSKYELGESNLDIPTLCSIADALEIDVLQLLDHQALPRQQSSVQRFGVFRSPALYVYMLSREKNYRIIKGYLTFYDNGTGHVSATFYMGVADFSSYLKCSVIYHGELICHPSNAFLNLVNQSDPADHTVIYSGIRMNSPDACYGMLVQSGYSTNDPGALKIILSTNPLIEGPELTEHLMINKVDFSHTRSTNIFGYKPGIISNEKVLPQ